ncbi:MAG: transporter substrate-binding domain-containing protein, partial [Lachnospiraceae bacterium]|nr:transporter substrate-binding domain-containing protein [Lachnospiraceae bacterium]
MKKVIALVLSLSMMAMVLTGCGSKGSASDANSKKWIVSTDTVFKPFEYTNDKNEFVGIDVDLLAAIAEDQGFDYELQSLGWDAAVAAVQAGQADAIIAGATIKQERIDN